MTLTKALLIFVLLVAAFNLFFYARFRRLMAEVRRRAAEQADTAPALAPAPTEKDEAQ